LAKRKAEEEEEEEVVVVRLAISRYIARALEWPDHFEKALLIKN
jgi:hypothetical protein